MRFVILVTGWNCKDFIETCYDSIVAQTQGNFKAIFILDGPTDGSEVELARVFGMHQDDRFVMEVHQDNVGAAKRRYDALQRADIHKLDVVLLLGMDDHLFPRCLKRVEHQYARGAWMTYGNWKDQRNKMLPPGFLDFDDHTHNTRAYRQVKYRSTAPNTFYKFLFDHIPAEDFQLDGRWVDSTTESEVMFSCLEMCGKSRIGIIREPIYHYNQRLPNGTLNRQGTEYKYAIYNRIIQRQPKPLLTKNDFGK